MGIGPRQKPARRLSQHAVEKALDAMHASKAERTLARQTYSKVLSGPRPVTLRAAEQRALDAVRATRAEAADRASSPA